MTTVELGVLVLAAYLTSTLSGIIGMGGGMTLLGVMTLLIPAPLVVPLHGIVQLGSNTTRTLIFLRHVRWSVFATYVPFLLIGVAASAAVYTGTKLTWFRPVIGLFLLSFIAWRRWKPRLERPPLWSYAPLGLFTGFLTLFVGATGPFLAPFFLRDDFTKEEIIATKAVCQTVAHIAKIPAFVALGFAYGDHAVELGVLLVMVIAGTMTGKRLLGRLPREAFVRLFVTVLGVLALVLIGRWAWELFAIAP
ncbi:MAG: sulfite exporter TauE/SafE family protein [Myxococcota bacterium]|nr:sulfite exporter TauE/SafE family protein [Myxococcota bacterium]